MPLGSDGNFDGTQGSKEGEIASVRRTGQALLPFEDGCKYAVKVKKRAFNETGALPKVAEPTGLEPATSDVTGRRSNQLNYDSAVNLKFSNLVGRHGGTRTPNLFLVREAVYH